MYSSGSDDLSSSQYTDLGLDLGHDPADHALAAKFPECISDTHMRMGHSLLHRMRLACILTYETGVLLASEGPSPQPTL